MMDSKQWQEMLGKPFETRLDRALAQAELFGAKSKEVQHTRKLILAAFHRTQPYEETFNVVWNGQKRSERFRQKMRITVRCQQTGQVLAEMDSEYLAQWVTGGVLKPGERFTVTVKRDSYALSDSVTITPANEVAQ